MTTPVPQPKHKIIIKEANPEKRTIFMVAYDEALKVARQFGSFGEYFPYRPPNENVLTVSELYDFQEVLDYLRSLDQ